MDRIRYPQDKARALQALAEAALKLKQSEQAVAWLKAAGEATTGMEDSWDKAYALRALAEAAAKAESWQLAREMADMIPSADGRIQTFSQILMIWAEKEALPAAKKKAAS